MLNSQSSTGSIPVKDSQQKRERTHFVFLDALRGLAAVWVVLYHLREHMEPVLSKLPNWLSYILFYRGGAGVDVFFVLSGFVIALSLRNTFLNWASFKNFALRRLIRLSVPYYASIAFALIFAVTATLIKGESLPLVTVPQILSHLVYLQDVLDIPHVNDAYWTLCLEIQFYLVFFGFLALAAWLSNNTSIKNGRLLVFASVTGLVTLWPLGIITYQDRPDTFFPYFYMFLLGVYAFWVWQGKMNHFFYYSYCILLLCAAIARNNQDIGIAVVVGILILEVARSNKLETWLKAPWLQFLGLISFSLYLTHTPVVGAVYFLHEKFLGTGTLSLLFYLVTSLSSALGVATLMWWCFEKPSIHWSRKLRM